MKHPDRNLTSFPQAKPTAQWPDTLAASKPTAPSSLPRAQRRAIRFKRVLEIVPLCPARIYELIANGEFPKPFKLVPGERARAVVWWEHEVYAYLEQRAAEGRTK